MAQIHSLDTSVHGRREIIELVHINARTTPPTSVSAAVVGLALGALGASFGLAPLATSVSYAQRCGAYCRLGAPLVDAAFASTMGYAQGGSSSRGLSATLPDTPFRPQVTPFRKDAISGKFSACCIRCFRESFESCTWANLV